MNKIEARQLWHAQLQTCRERSHSELCSEVGQSRRFETIGQSGTSYQGKVQIFWDDKPNGAIRVLASIDDGGWRAFVPRTEDFILTPDGTLAGE